MIENCVMEGWHPDGYPGNIAYSPELWEWMFSLGLYLNWDPSHLMWIGIDPVGDDPAVHRPDRACPGEGRRARRAGTQPVTASSASSIRGATRGRRGGGATASRAAARSTGRGVVDRLYEAGFGGVLSVEHEDPVWGGTDVKILQGLTIAQRTLRPLVLPESG